jgi:hypothetical protein
MVKGSVPDCDEMKRPLISYAGSAAETSIGSKPMGNESAVIMVTKTSLSRHF